MNDWNCYLKAEKWMSKWEILFISVFVFVNLQPMLVVTQASSLIWQQRTLKIHSMIAQSEPLADSHYSGAQVKWLPPPKKIVLPGNSSARELISGQFRLEVNHWRKNRLKHISSLKTTAAAITTTTTTTATTKIRKTPFDHSFVSTSSWRDC